MPWNTKQRTIAIILLNLVYLVILVTVNHSDGDATAVLTTLTSRTSKESPPLEAITENTSEMTSQESSNNEHTSSYNDEEITSEKKSQRDTLVATKNISGNVVTAINGTGKRVMGDRHSDNNGLKNDVSDGAEVTNNDGVSPTITQTTGQTMSQNERISTRRPMAPRKHSAIQLRTDKETPLKSSDTRQASSQEYQTAFIPLSPEAQEVLYTSLSRDEVNSSHVRIKYSHSRRYQEATESPSPVHKASGGQESTKTPTSLFKGNLESAEFSPTNDDKADQNTTSNYNSGGQQTTEGYLPRVRDASENSPSGNQERTKSLLPGDQEVGEASLPVGHEAIAASLPENQVITETSFTGVSSPEANKGFIESPVTGHPGTSSQETVQGPPVDPLSGGSPVAPRASTLGGLETTGVPIPSDPKPRKPSSSEGQADPINLDITVNTTGVTVAVNDKQVYSALNNTKIWNIGPVRLHAGIHLIALHQVTGQVMAVNSYMTWQTGIDRQFLEDLENIQDGRLLVILGAPDFTTFLEEATITRLVEMGGLYIDSLAYKDVWCLVVHKGGGVVLEALTTSLPGHNMNNLEVSPLTVQVSVPRRGERGCGWYGREGMQERATFCETYDGYGNFCSCHDPPWSPLPHNIVEYRVEEVIPVAIVTAHRLPHVLRQVGQLWSSPGGTITPITIFVDGHNPEAQALAALLNLPLVEHHNPAPLGWTSRISSHVKSVLSKVFERYPEADKAIILEDDLDLSVDFIPYFHQTATLLASDPKLLCVNAYNYNAFFHTALDPTRLYRVHGIPAYGWMVRRGVAQEMVRKWAPLNETLDWDWWLRYNVMGERDILVPEIPRTKHRGGGGVHITGLEQVYYYDQRPLNTQPNVTIDINGAELTTYLDFHYDAIRRGQVLRFTTHPCKDLPIPRHPVNQSYVLYVNQPDNSKKSSWSYYVGARCLGFNDRNFHENLQMMFTGSFYGNQLYLITCPHSPFCLTEDPEDVLNATKEDVLYATQHPFRKMKTFMHAATRVHPLSLSDEVHLTNLVHATTEVFISEKW